jgi:hypothetical protein
LASIINASNSGFGGIVSTGDSSGQLALQAAGTTIATLTSTGAAITGTLSSTGALGLAIWTTATRPASPVTGAMGYNTTTGRMEVWTGSYWGSSALTAGITTTFTSSTTWTVPAGISSVTVYIAGAGGGGGGGGSGGGCGYATGGAGGSGASGASISYAGVGGGTGGNYDGGTGGNGGGANYNGPYTYTVTPGASITITVAAGGSGGIGGLYRGGSSGGSFGGRGGSAGAAGGQSSFGAFITTSGSTATTGITGTAVNGASSTLTAPIESWNNNGLYNGRTGGVGGAGYVQISY